MKIQLERKGGKFAYEASNEAGYKVGMDSGVKFGGDGAGFSPMEMLLVGMGGCSGIDVVSLLEKQKEPLEDVKITIEATRRQNEIPSIFETIQVHFDLYGKLNADKVERSLQLTFSKYCSVAIIIGHSATINYSFTIH